MSAVDVPQPLRRWSKRRLVLVVSALVAAVLGLVVALVGFARSVDFVLGAGSASDALSEVGQIAPDRAATGGSFVTSPRVAAEAPTTSDVTTSEPTWTPPVAVASSAPRASGGGGAATSSSAVASGGKSDGAEAAAGTGGLGGYGGMAGTGAGGIAGASPSTLESVVSSALVLLGQTTSTMCGFNTCNVGQVCCNFSCGVCASPGTSCDQAQCAGAPRAPTAVRCGAGQCNDGQVCCNPSCGICASPGESCSSDSCP